MDRLLRIVGIVVVVWLAIGLIGWLLGALVKTVFVIALIAAAVWLVGAITNRGRSRIGVRR